MKPMSEAHCIVLIAARTFILIRVSPAKAAINSDRAIAGKQTGGLLPCREECLAQAGTVELPSEDGIPRASPLTPERSRAHATSVSGHVR